MRTFARLINELDSTNKTSAKTAAIHRFLDVAHDRDKLWLLALFTGRRPKRPVNANLMRTWAMEVTGIPQWLFVECYASVGDLGETIALLLPAPLQAEDKPLYEWMDEIRALKALPEAQKREYVLERWSVLGPMERFIFNKLIGGSFRVGVSSKGMINALARYYNLDESAVAHSIMGDWDPDSVTFESLVRGEYANTDLSKPYPFCLAHALESDIEALKPLSDWQFEYKWDGIRGQIIKRNGEVFIWSRGEELISDQFPELVQEVLTWDGNFVLDGEILAIRNGEVCNFSELQKRLNRKNLSRKMLADIPAGMYIYDLLEWNHEDWRQRPLVQRREKLEWLLRDKNPMLRPSVIIGCANAEDLRAIREKARDKNSEGLMLKHKQSTYHAGRKKGDWWKWKIDPYTMDAVLIYAQKGSGRRSSYYTDYTFAVRDGDALVTIAKAYSGLTDKEIQEVSRFVNKNAVEKFGPVRTVKPELVFEIAFEGIGYSSRHKSGVAVRFPRILRWRKDKTANEIDDLETVKKLIRQ